MKIKKTIKPRVIKRFKFMFGSAILMMSSAYLADNYFTDFMQAAFAKDETSFSGLFVNAEGVMFEGEPSRRLAVDASVMLEAEKATNLLNIEAKKGPYKEFFSNGYLEVSADTKVCTR